MFRKLIAAVALVSSVARLATDEAQAAPLELVWEGGIVNRQLNGINNVDLGALGIFNVSFIDGSYNSIFGTTFDFASRGEAMIASEGLINIFNDDYHLDNIPSIVRGLTAYYGAIIITPFELFDESTLYYSGFQNLNDIYYSPNDNVSQRSIAPTYDTRIDGNYVYADWEQVSVVPLPPSAILFGTALFSLGVIRRRKKQAA